MEVSDDAHRHLERYRDCADAIASAVTELIEKAVASGWTHNEVTTALVNLAVDLLPESPGEEGKQPPLVVRH